MKEIGLRQSESEIKRYLYGEMTDGERALWEEKIFGDDELFYSIANLENELVDAYARGEIKGAELESFERALDYSPARRAKIANAAALQNFIAEERAPEKSFAAVVPARQTFGQKLAQMFSLNAQAFAYAAAAMLFVFALASVFLLLDNRRKADEIARLETGRTDNLQSRQTELENQLKDSQEREGELKNQIDDERAASGDLTDELMREKQRRERIESDLERLRREENAARPSVASPKESAPVVASILLAPSVGLRGGVSGKAAQTVEVSQGTKRVAVRLALPDDADKSGRFFVALNDKIIAGDLAVLVSGGGQKALQITVAPAGLLDGANKFTVSDSAGAQVGRYVFNARKK